LPNGVIKVPEKILFSLKLLIERKICRQSGHLTQFQRNILKISPANSLDYISDKLNTYIWLPTVVLFHVAEQIKPTGINDTVDYLREEFAKSDATVEKIVSMTIKKLNIADDMMHRAAQQNAYRAPAP